MGVPPTKLGQGFDDDDGNDDDDIYEGLYFSKLELETVQMC